MPSGFGGLPTIFGGLRYGKKGATGGIVSPIKILGVPQAVAKLRGVDSVVRLELGFLGYTAAGAIERRAKQYVPVKTGNLRSSIRAEKVSSYTWNVIASSMDGNVASKNWYEYAPYVEYGWVGHKAELFMTRAYNEVFPYIMSDLKLLGKKLESMGI